MALLTSSSIIAYGSYKTQILYMTEIRNLHLVQIQSRIIL